MESFAFASVFDNEEWLRGELNLAEGQGEPGGGHTAPRSGMIAVQSNKIDMQMSMSAVTEDERNDEGGESGSDQDPDGVGIKSRTKAKSPVKRRGSTVDRRRERNRVLARKTRLRKKYFFESLQLQVSQLMAENRNLKAIVSDKIPAEVSSKVLAECNSEIPSRISMQKKASDTSTVTVNPGIPQQVVKRTDRDYMHSLHCSQRSFIITDPSKPDNPIMFASPGFLELTKYSLSEVVGRNCRFMQGPGTDAAELNVLRQGIAEGRDTSVTLLNYKKDGTMFWNQVFVAGLKNAMGKIVNYVGLQTEVKNADAQVGSSSTASAAGRDEGLRRGMRQSTQKSSLGVTGILGGVGEARGSAVVTVNEAPQSPDLPTRPPREMHGSTHRGIETHQPTRTEAGLGDEIFEVGEGFAFNSDANLDFRFTMGDDNEQAGGDGSRRQRGGSLSLPGTRLTPVPMQISQSPGGTH